MIALSTFPCLTRVCKLEAQTACFSFLTRVNSGWSEIYHKMDMARQSSSFSSFFVAALYCGLLCGDLLLCV